MLNEFPSRFISQAKMPLWGRKTNCWTRCILKSGCRYDHSSNAKRNCGRSRSECSRKLERGNSSWITGCLRRAWCSSDYKPTSVSRNHYYGLRETLSLLCMSLHLNASTSLNTHTHKRAPLNVRSAKIYRFSTRPKSKKRILQANAHGFK